MIKGYCNLYKLQLQLLEKVHLPRMEETKHVYMIEKEGEWYKLDVEASPQSGASTYIIKKKYKGILKVIMNDCEMENARIDGLKFRDQAMMAIVSDYNKCKRPSEISEVIEYKTKEKWSCFVLGNYNMLTKNRAVVDQNRITSGFLSGGLLIGYTDSKISKHVTMNLGVNFNYIEIDDFFTEEQALKVDFTLIANYRFLNNNSVSPFFTLGAIVNDFHLIYGGGIDFNRIRVYFNCKAETFNTFKDTSLIEIGLGYKIFGS